MGPGSGPGPVPGPGPIIGTRNDRDGDQSSRPEMTGTGTNLRDQKLPGPFPVPVPRRSLVLTSDTAGVEVPQKIFTLQFVYIQFILIPETTANIYTEFGIKESLF